ncbi:MAG TPA: TonB-dependent receptor [Vicinamibacterales bacterium]|nr:TonB-dependent receptor [Vicinamibacterales bacterium]
MLTRAWRFDLSSVLWKISLVLLLSIGWVGTQAAQTSAQRCGIAGSVSSGSSPLPGVAVTAVAADGHEVATTATEPSGVYELRVPGPGSYGIRAELSAFATVNRQISLTVDACTTRLDLSLVLASRTPAPSPASVRSATPGQPSASTPRGPANPPQNASAARGRGGVVAGAAGRGRGGFQQLEVVESATGAEAPAGATEESVETLRSQLQLPPGFSTDAPTETVATAGNQGQLNEALLFGGRGGRDGGPEGFDPFGGENGSGDVTGGGQAGFGGGGRGGGPGGFGGGGFGGPGGPLGGLRGGGGRLQGTANYTLGGSMFDAAPFALRGQPVDKPDYTQQRYGTAFGGPLKIPHIYNGGTRTSFFLNYSGNRSRNPVDSYSTVPTPAERAGDFSSDPAQLFDPLTGQPFQGNVIPSDRLSSASLTLLPFIPEPNLPGDTQNFHYLTAVTSASDDVNLRLTHVFGADLPQRGGRGGRGGFQPGGGRGGGFGGRGGPGGPGGRGPTRPRSVLNVNVSYHHTSAVQSSTFPTIGGTTTGQAWNVPVSYMYAHGPFNNILNVTYNRNSAESTNLYAFTNNIVGAAGIQGVSTDPFDWGLPSLSFTTIADVRDRIPSRRVDQRFQLSDTMMRTFGKHAVRIGGDFRGISIDSLTNTNPRGSFVFTGLYTSSVINGRAVPGTGLDVADFLLGLSQQASVQYGPGTIKLRGHTMSLFAQDDWRVRGNLTINYGLRYEYVSPFVEADNRLVNLDVPPDFTGAVPVEAGQTGPFTGPFPLSLVQPDRNNFGPRVGIAWKPEPKITIRTGYGINYNLGAYGTIAQRLAGQPPFAVTATTLGGLEAPLAIVDPFAGVESSTTTNSYGIDRFFQLGVAQIWNVDVQRDLPKNLTLNVGYTGTHGTDLDIQRAPNRDPDGGVRIPDVQPFLWESSEGHSTLHTVNVRVRKRLARGISFGGAYIWAHAFDNASSIGGGGATVAQNDQDLNAEWGRSSFERRHTVNADYLIELPWGKGRHWLDNNRVMSQIFGGWSWSGNLTAQSGSPFTARVVGNFLDVSNGVNGTLRADYNGQPISISDPTIQRFFNTDAFTVPPPGFFGSAARNTIIGPGYLNVNMALSKNFNFSRSRGMTIRVQASNIFNNVEFSTIDTVVNSPTFGEVIGVRPMRSIQLLTRFRF